MMSNRLEAQMFVTLKGRLLLREENEQMMHEENRLIVLALMKEKEPQLSEKRGVEITVM